MSSKVTKTQPAFQYTGGTITTAQVVQSDAKSGNINKLSLEVIEDFKRQKHNGSTQPQSAAIALVVLDRSLLQHHVDESAQDVGLPSELPLTSSEVNFHGISTQRYR